MREREPQATSTEFGKDHSAVVALQQKHLALETELLGGFRVGEREGWREREIKRERKKEGWRKRKIHST